MGATGMKVQGRVMPTRRDRAHESPAAASLPLGGEVAEAELLALYARGDQSAARVLTLRHAPRLHALAWRMLRDRTEAEDVTQETMLRLWRVASNWEDRGVAVGTWLYRVAANLCLDRLRRRRERPLEAAGDPPDPALPPEARLQADTRSAALQQAVAALPERQRLATLLRHFEGLSNPEIAAALETSVEAVESLLSRARRDLAARLGPRRAELGYEDG